MSDISLAYGSDAVASPVYVELIAGDPCHLITRKGTLASGQNLKRGALLGQITAGGKYVLSLAAAANGSEDPVAVLVHDTDATAADTEILFYERGDFNQSAVTFGTGHTADSTRAALRTLGIFFIKPYGA